MNQRPVLEVATRQDIEALQAEIAALRRSLEAATVTPKPTWVSPKRAAEELGVCVQTIRNKCATGELKSRGTGKTRRVCLDVWR